MSFQHLIRRSNFFSLSSFGSRNTVHHLHKPLLWQPKVNFARASTTKGRLAGNSTPPSSITLSNLVIDDPLCVEKLRSLEGPARDDFARTALKIGISTMHHINFHVDVDRLRSESTRLLELLQQQLDTSSQRMSDQMSAQLAEYFNPNSGRFNARIERLLAEDGDIQRVLNRNLERHETELAHTLTENVGSQSPLMKLLSPNESAGLVSAIRSMVEQQLSQQRQQILMQFSLDHPDSALRRLIQQLNINQTQLQSDVQNQIQGIVKEFSLDNRSSALSRLVENVQTAQRTISSEFSFDNETSAFSRLHRMLDSTHELIDGRLTLDEASSPLALLKRELVGLLDQHAERTRVFQEEVKVSLAEMAQERKLAKLRGNSTREGLDFEEALQGFLGGLCAAAGDILIPTGATTGEIRHCKVGDAVLELGPDSASPGARIVVEAKQDKAYTLAKALREMEIARKNRSASFGLFVFGKDVAPPELDGLARYGADIVVAWDPQDPEQASDVYLRAAVMALRALVMSQGNLGKEAGEGGQSVEHIRALHLQLDRSLLEIEKRVNSLDDVTKSAQTIQNASTKILDRIRISRTALLSQVRTLEDVAEQFNALHHKQLSDSGEPGMEAVEETSS